MIIGLTGKRHVGKSKAAEFLEEAGFIRAHTFEGGKVAAAAYFEHIGATHDEAQRMVYGDLRDVPSPLLPGKAKPRELLEPFGYFMGTGMGPEWTLGTELERIKTIAPFANVVFESIVYEAETLRAAGGILVRITRPGDEGPTGMKTDAAQAQIKEDVEIMNTGSLDALREKIIALTV